MTNSTNLTNLTNLSVAILISDIEEVKEITNVFRKLGVIPYFYEDLKTFWQGTLERMPMLAIVDVKRMSEGNLVLKNHPSVMTEELPLLFYYSEQTEPLLVSTQEIFHLGTIKKAAQYEGVFKGLLKRINKMIMLEQENRHLKFSLKAKSDENKLLEAEKNTLHKIDFYQNLSKEVCSLISNSHHEQDFLVTIEKVFQTVKEFDAFSVVELSFNGQKLISPLSHVKKFRAIPSIWLGQVCKEGIELFAQNMASQVALEVLGDNVVSILINGVNGKPEKIVFIKAIDELCFNQFDWTLFESFLNGLNSSIKLNERREITHTRKIGNTFEAMSFLDQYIFGGLLEDNNQKLNKIDYSLVNVDLTTIAEIILKNGNQRFFWSKFRTDFISRFEVQSRFEFNYFENGVTDISFLVSANNVDEFFDELKEYAHKFSYWKYFENNDAIVFQEVKPRIFMTPMSAHAYLKKTLENKISERDMNLEKAHKRQHFEIHWDRVRENEI